MRNENCRHCSPPFAGPGAGTADTGSPLATTLHISGTVTAIRAVEKPPVPDRTYQ